MALIAVGLAAPASANAAVPKHPTVQGFLAAVRAAGITAAAVGALGSSPAELRRKWLGFWSNGVWNPI
jgi:hypothetical protein